MKIFFAHRSAQGQASMEYILLLAVVAVLVIASFRQGGLIDQIENSSQGYYNTVTKVILDDDNATQVNGVWTDKDNPTPINGGWCPVTCPDPGTVGPTIMYGACECPAPAFGGLNCPSVSVACTGSAISSWSNNAGGVCKGQQISCQGVIPENPAGGGANCNLQGGCPTGMTCNTALNQCQCNTGTYWNGTACAQCSQSACTPTQQCGSTTGVNACNQPCTISSPATCPNSGQSCVSGRCVCPTAGTCPTITTVVNGVTTTTTAQCGPDTCGNAQGCNTCVPPQECVSGNTACVTPTSCTAVCGGVSGTDNFGQPCAGNTSCTWPASCTAAGQCVCSSANCSAGQTCNAAGQCAAPSGSTS